MHVQAQLRDVAGRATSSDGAVTVTVNVGGALESLELGPAADRLTRAQLGSLIVRTAKAAQADAGRQAAAAVEPIVGADSDAMRFLRDQLSSPELEQQPELPTRSQAQPRPDDDDDRGYRSILR
jgi:DNA-binding protein YbaB